jgi:Carboxypeptidase regulatory-like domain
MRYSNGNQRIGGRFAFILLSGLLVFALRPGLARAQQATAAISGTIVDATGRGVPGAMVMVKSLETGATRTVTTDETGGFLVLSLPVGRYEVRVDKTGFKSVVHSNVNLVVGQEAVINMHLDVGAVKQVVTVTGDLPQVNTTTYSTSGLVDEQQVKELPLNGRSFDNLVTLNPSTANVTSYRSPTSTGGGQGNNFSIAGNREDHNLFALNGIEYTGVSTADVSPGGVSGQLLGIDAVREFNVLENSYGAEYGKRAGGQISVVTMSGTNSFHGTAFEFLRNSVLDARNFFDQGSIPPFKRNQFGGSAGGPIKRDKTFIFGNYEGFRQRLGLSSVAIVPDDRARNGTLVDPKTGKPIGLAPGIQPYFALWPKQNGPEILDAQGNLTGAAFSFSHPGQRIREDFGNIRGDQVFSQRDTLSGVYTIDDGDSLTPGQNPLQQVSSILRAQVFSLQETHVFSPSLLNTARAGFSRAKWQLDGSPAADMPGLSFVPGHPVGSIAIGSSGLGNVGSFASAGTFGAQQIEIVARNLFTYADDLEMTRGRHSLSLGVWFQRVQANDNAADQRNGVASFADLKHFMQGQAQQLVATLDPTEVGWRQFAGAWYAQDAMKLRRNLTLSLGLRHEFNNGWNSPDGRASNFVFGPNGVLLTQPVIGSSIYSTNDAKALFGPRAGLAWSPFGWTRTAVHAGFGIYYQQLDYMGSCCDASPLPPFNDKVTVGSAQVPATFPVQMTPNLPGATVAPSGVDPNLKTPTVEQYSFRIEQGLWKKAQFTVGFVGQHGYHLLNTVDVNAAIPTVCPASSCPASLPAGTKVFPPKSPRANPNLGNSRYTLSNANSNYNALQVDVARRFSEGFQFRGSYTFSKSLDLHSSSFLANSGVGGATTILDPQDPRRDRGPSNFDVTHRFTGSFTYDLPFGRGKALLGKVSGVADRLISGWQWNGIAAVQSGFPFTPLVGFNASGNGDSRAPDRVCLGASAGCNSPPPANGFGTGSPTQWFDPSTFRLPCNSLVAVANQPSCPTTVIAAKTVILGTYGTAGRDILRGPGLGEFDMSLFKTTTITERVRLQFRAEFFNLLNRANFGMPIVTTFTSSGGASPSAGRITYTATTSRQTQFGVKLLW